MKYADILRGQVAELETERAALADELDTLDPTDTTRSADAVEARATEILERAAAIKADIDAKNETIRANEALEAERAAAPRGPTFLKTTPKAEALDIVNDRSATPTQLADALTRSVEGQVESPENMAHFRTIAKRHAEDRDWARSLIARSRPEYESAFFKVITGRSYLLSGEERAALSTTTSANGDYLVPTHLDPTIILSNSGSSNVMRQHATIKTLTRPGDSSWQGITSAGVTASFDGQIAEVSDDTPTFSQPSIAVHKAQALIQASIEATEDIPGIATELLML